MSADGKDTPRDPWRPSKYDPAYCDSVVAWGRAGKSRAWICAELGVVRQTLKNWEAEHPDFLVAMERAKLFEQQWWEDAGQGGMAADKFNGQIWSRSMAARFPDDWREKSETTNNTTLNAGDGFAALLGKIASQPVFPKDDDSSPTG